MSQSPPSLHKILKDQFGFSQFRPGQEAIIQTLLEHGRVLCIQPTGYGKSLLYQLPAVVLGGITVVISPLLALMRDQVSHLTHRFQIPAASINSDQSEEENEAAMQRAAKGELRILFIAPERLDNLEVYRFLQSLDVSLLVVDEAHCISTWGHDFRPAYRQIVRAVHDFEQRFPNLKVLGLTATANRHTEGDIAEQLRSPQGKPLQVMRAGMDRPNLSLAILRVDGLGEKLALLEWSLAKSDGCGLLYCATREQTEIVAQYLCRRGIEVEAYHAGLDPMQKRKLQQEFISGKARIIAATNALGMGIDKPDIRFIVHVDVPSSITAYYQEVGRAGRDGLPARGLLLYDPADRKVQDYFIRNAQPVPEDFRMILDAVKAKAGQALPTLTEIKMRTGLHPTRVTVVLAELMEQGFVEKQLDGRRQVYGSSGNEGSVDMSRYARQLSVRTGELNRMLAYGEGNPDCLMADLRRALGEDDVPPCERCSLCQPGAHAPHLVIPDAKAAWQWLSIRDIPIPAAKVLKMSEGQAALSSDLPTPMFRRFMVQRADREGKPAVDMLASELLELVLQKIDVLSWKHKFGAVIVLPSRTWRQREHVGQAVAERLKAALLLDLLYWDPYPRNRQGELHNNDQRRANVQGFMRLEGPLAVPRHTGLLLLDDYFGSLATLKEAARVLRKQAGFKGEIVPFTLARVRWRLGAPGMVG